MNNFPLLTLHDIKKIPDEKKKKQPGRPRKATHKITPIQLPPSVSNPPSNILFDLFYNNPNTFKRALGFFLSLSDMPLHCKFTPTSIRLLALDRHKKSKIEITIDPSKLLHYHCKAPYSFGISTQYLEVQAKKINTDLSTIKWYGIEGKTEETYLSYYAPEYKETRNETLLCCARYTPIDEDGFDDSDYQIRWQWKSRWFKHKLNNIKISSDQLTIKQIGAEHPLMIVYSNNNGHIKSEEILEGKEEMNFKSTIKPGEIFSVSVQIKYWYPVANSSTLDTVVEIALHKDKPIITKIVMDDGAITIKVLTAVNNMTQDSDINNMTSMSTKTPKAESVPTLDLSKIKYSPFDQGINLDNSCLNTPKIGNSVPGTPRAQSPIPHEIKEPPSPKPRIQLPSLPKFIVAPLSPTISILDQLKIANRQRSQPSSPTSGEISPRLPTSGEISPRLPTSGEISPRLPQSSRPLRSQSPTSGEISPRLPQSSRPLRSQSPTSSGISPRLPTSGKTSPRIITALDIRKKREIDIPE